ncbi:sugar ABC transporter substrate-binding protein [Paracoccus onubensis]|uniref:ABC transporter substrate-binding protein n=1 Tax=Paracoccus onubensis TaxID=1675788 RepID=UPI00272F3EF3|nr:sugar ABC transporter substrate-binding protein [Paracoccus onubensis]MDP0929083.1 sugar ABC transporter substrate-binding protein [Paracoccus onubensis]
MTTKFRILMGATALCASAGIAAAQDVTLTVATVNNGDMIRMQGLTSEFEAANPGIKIEWVVLEENVLREKVTTDIATNGGQYDVMTIGTYEVPIWGRQEWLKPLEMSAEYDVDDLLPTIREALSVDGTLYAAPFYGESAMVMYRTDLMEQAGLEMPDEPTWDFIREAAEKMHDPDNGVYGICLRGKAGWGENMALLTSMANSFGGKWFDMEWVPQFDQKPWQNAITYYVDIMTNFGPPGVSTNGFNENLALFQTGKCGMWYDATVAAGFVTNPIDSTVADKVGFAQAPSAEGGQKANWLWAWTLAIPASSENAEAAQTFIEWATGKGYTELVAEKEGWIAAPPGTRTSLYGNPEYTKVAPFAEMTLAAINSANPGSPTVDEVPYVGAQYVAIPEFQGIATTVGQLFSAAASGQSSPEEALAAAQATTTREMSRAGYPK